MIIIIQPDGIILTSTSKYGLDKNPCDTQVIHLWFPFDQKVDSKVATVAFLETTFNKRGLSHKTLFSKPLQD